MRKIAGINRIQQRNALAVFLSDKRRRFPVSGIFSLRRIHLAPLYQSTPVPAIQNKANGIVWSKYVSPSAASGGFSVACRAALRYDYSRSAGKKLPARQAETEGGLEGDRKALQSKT